MRDGPDPVLLWLPPAGQYDEALLLVYQNTPHYKQQISCNQLMHALRDKPRTRCHTREHQPYRTER